MVDEPQDIGAHRGCARRLGRVQGVARVQRIPAEAALRERGAVRRADRKVEGRPGRAFQAKGGLFETEHRTCLETLREEEVRRQGAA